MNRVTMTSRKWKANREAALYWRLLNKFLRQGMSRSEAEELAAARAQGRMTPA